MRCTFTLQFRHLRHAFALDGMLDFGWLHTALLPHHDADPLPRLHNKNISLDGVRDCCWQAHLEIDHLGRQCIDLQLVKGKYGVVDLVWDGEVQEKL